MENRRFEQGTEEWLEMRRSKITASDVATILGENPYQTPYQLWREKMGLETREVNKAMQFGIDNENAARERYIDFTKKNVAPMVVTHPFHDWLMASLDGVTFRADHACEIKSIMSVNSFDKPIPRYHQIQMEVQAACLGLSSIDYVRDDGFEQQIIKYECDPNFLNNNLDKLREFYRCIVDKIPPPYSDSDYPVRDDFEWIATMQRYFDLDQIIKLHTEELEEVKRKLIELAQGQPSQGGGGRLSKITRKGNIDYGKIEALKDIDLEQYRKKDSIYWSVKANGNPT